MARSITDDSFIDNARGREAEQPSEIPAPGWRDIALRIKNELDQDNISLVAAGVAFYGLLAIFPALAALVSIYGLVADPATVEQQAASLTGLLPEEAKGIITGQLHEIAAGAKGALSIAAVGGLLLTLWSATKGVNALITALNIVYDEQERRGFIKLSLLALLLTLGAIIFVIVALSLVVVLPALLEGLGLKESAETWIAVLRWPLLAGFVMLGLAVLYRYGPSRDKPRWQWVSWGAAIATALWLIGSGLFSFYVSHFGSYNETYGSVGAVVVLLMWFYLTAYIMLLGAEINAEMEHQTRKDTTEGAPKPMGQRNAYMADTLGESPGQTGESSTASAASPNPAARLKKAASPGSGAAQAQPQNEGDGQQRGVPEGSSARPSDADRQKEEFVALVSALGRGVQKNPLATLLVGIGIAWLAVAHSKDRKEW